MSTDAKGSASPTSKKSVYSAPTLTLFGGLRELTLAQIELPNMDNSTKGGSKT